MKALVTGGAGFIGSHIVDALTTRGMEVTVVDDLSSGSLKNLSSKKGFNQLDIRDPKMRELLKREKPDILVHAAAQISVRQSMEDPTFDVDVNVRGLVNMLQAFESGKLPRVVFLSTGGAIYGEQTKFPAPEDHPINPTSIYGLSKRAAEMYLEFWGRELGLKYCVLRLANVYGPRQNPHGEAGVVAIFVKKLLKGERPCINGSGKQTRDFVYVGDVAKAVETACTGKFEGVYNIGTGVETSVNELTQMIYKGCDINFNPEYGPEKPGEQSRSSIDSSLAKKVMGWKAGMTLAEGVRQTVEYFRKEPA